MSQIASSSMSLFIGMFHFKEKRINLKLIKQTNLIVSVEKRTNFTAAAMMNCEKFPTLNIESKKIWE